MGSFDCGSKLVDLACTVTVLTLSHTVDWRPVDISLSDLVTKQVLGRGSYGFVTLMTDAREAHLPEDQKTLYALKAVSKQRVVETHQKGHIYNEKMLMAQLCHPFLVKLLATFKDEHLLYFLMEPCRGGIPISHL